MNTEVKTESRELFEKVIEKDYCIGCGACALVENSPFKIVMNKFGNIVAEVEGDIDKSDAKVLEVCPFSGNSKNENELGNIFFDSVKNGDNKIGKYIKNYAGYVSDERFRDRGSSGGVGKWVGYKLLDENKIDYFIQVVPNQTKQTDVPLFDYQVIENKEDVLKGSKSSYYPVSLVNIINTIREKDGRYAITGVPCFIKTLRLMSLKEPILKKRIKYTIGIICGGMKSANQAKMIGWQLGVHPNNITAIDFRRKYKDKPASFKIYQVWSNKDDVERYRDSYQIYGTDWGSGYFKPNACDYCDDVVNETSDISIGDAWLPKYESDPKGTTITIVRNPEIHDLLAENIDSGALTLEEVSAEEVAISQAGGFRHRREALSYRIAKKERKNEWYPEKRVKANEFNISRKRKYIYALREKIAQKSHLAFYKALEKNDLSIFFREMKPLFKKYHSANYGNIVVRGLKKVIRIAKGIIKK